MFRRDLKNERKRGVGGVKSSPEKTARRLGASSAMKQDTLSGSVRFGRSAKEEK